MIYNDAANLVAGEYSRARDIFPAMKSAHEGLAVIWEEFEELKAEVFKPPLGVGRSKSDCRNPALLRKEAVQVAAMAMRFLVDVCERPAK